ncbi:hypothetical protein ACFQQB_46795 [Nonomuraea rubra]
MFEQVSRRAVVTGLLLLVPAAATPLPGSPILPPSCAACGPDGVRP